MAKPKKPKRPKKLFDSGKKKVAVIILILGLVIMAVGFFYPSQYWKGKNAHSSAELEDDQSKSPTLVLYDSWDKGDEVSIHDTVKSIKEMMGTIYIEGVTYTDYIDLTGRVLELTDNHLVELEGGHYFVVTGAKTPPLSVGDSVLVSGTVKEIVGKTNSGVDARREIVFVDPSDIEKNNMDMVFMVVGIMGIVIALVGLAVWMFFVFVPEEKEPSYVNVHEERKKDFLEQVAKPQQGKEYPCPICGLNMTYKAEFGKWYCEICNKMF